MKPFHLVLLPLAASLILGCFCFLFSMLDGKVRLRELFYVICGLYLAFQIIAIFTWIFERKMLKGK